MRVLGISGSLRAASHNTQLLRAAAELLPPGAELEIRERAVDLPAFDEDAEHDPPAAVRALRRAVAGADALLIATPEYNHSLPGGLKNALDWLSRPPGASPARGKPALVIGASTGLFGAVWAQAEGRKVLEALGARVVDVEVPVAKAREGFGDDGRLLDAELAGRLAAALGLLVEERPPLAA